MNHIEKIKMLVEGAAVYVPFNCEGVRITTYDHDSKMFNGVGEESGEEYNINYESVSLDDDMFYKLVLMKIPE